MKKISLGGLISGIAMVIAFMVVGQAFQFLFPSIKKEYTNANLFRPWADPLMSVVFLVPFITAFVSAWMWSKVKEIFKSGISFGFVIWLLGISGMIISYGTFPVSFLMILSWTTAGLVQYLLMGIILAKMIK